MKRTRLPSVLLAVGLLIGCGGGDDDPPAETPAATADAGAPPADGAPIADGAVPPPPPPPRLEGLAGRFAGEELVLELVEAGEALHGTMTFKGETFPVRARKTGPTDLRGSFTSKGRSYPIEASLSEGSMKLTSSNTTYDLVREAPVNVVDLWIQSGTSDPRAPYAGVFLGTFVDRPACLELAEVEGAVTGSFSCAGTRYSVTGSRQGAAVSGSIDDATTGARLLFQGALDGESLTLWLAGGTPTKQVTVHLVRSGP